MSATDRTADFDVGSIVHVRFRVRGERLGHGEEVFLVVTDSDQRVTKTIPLHTTATRYPWYRSAAPITLTIPGRRKAVKPFVYRYAIHRAGVFHRFEEPEDCPADLRAAKALVPGGSSQNLHIAEEDLEECGQLHQIPLQLVQANESYVVSDVLGFYGKPDIDHVHITSNAQIKADTLHARTNSQDMSAPSLRGQGSGSGLAAAGKSPAPGKGRKKAVGFAPQPVPYHTLKPTPTKQAVNLNSTDGLVVVSIFLPVVLHREVVNGTPAWTADWDYEMLLSMQTHLRVVRVGVVKWRGWHGHSGKDGSPERGVPVQERHLVEECLRTLNCVPVWVDTILFGDMYNGFCKGVIWPVLHNGTSVYSNRPDDNRFAGGHNRESARNDPQQFSEYSMDDVEQGPVHGGRGREAEMWSSYNTVNRQFADAVVECFNRGDLVWIHGFHLLILPSYLTRKIPMAKVGIFLHTPFPSSEIFRTLWCREDLLRGMLNADQIGFHLFEYARHFLTSCRRLLGLNYGMIPDDSGGHTLAIDTNGRHVAVTSIHAGVEPSVLGQILSHPTTIKKAASIRERMQGKHIFCSVDRLESLKGIPLKLLGLERFLRRCPEWVGKIVLYQVGISAFERGDDYNLTKKEVVKLVDKINGEWPGTVVFQECIESEMRLQQRMALLRAADIVVVTSIRDGLNLLPLEFTTAHQDALSEAGKKDGRKRGICILSEFTSCTRVMRGALHINPWKIAEIANSFYMALNMSEDERLRRIRIASEFVSRVSTQRWALAVMLDLKGVHKTENLVNVAGAGLGLGFRLLGMDQGFGSLDMIKVARAYRTSRARLILVDYGGTIVSNDNLDNLTRFKMVRERRAPSTPRPEMLAALKKLCEDKRNTVFVVSGKERHSLTSSLGGIPNLGMAAEHGMFISWPTSSGSDKRRWETLVPETDRTWRGLAMSIMEVYTSRTHGSYVEETEMKVLWQYRDADTEFGSLQAKELEDHLSKYLRSFPVDILHGGIQEGGYVEVRPKGVNKGVLAMRVVKRFPEVNQEKVDFALVLGDDHCDEPMLSVMRQIGRRVYSSRRAQMGEAPLPEPTASLQVVDVSACDNFVSTDLDVFTCTVGKKPSAAANYLHSVEEVEELLQSLVRVSTRDPRHFSAMDLTSFAPSRQKTGSTMNRATSDGNLKDNDRPSAPFGLTGWLGTIEDAGDGAEDDDEDGVFF